MFRPNRLLAAVVRGLAGALGVVIALIFCDLSDTWLVLGVIPAFLAGCLWPEQPPGAWRIVTAIVLACLAALCAFGFLASFELGFPNVFHVIYGLLGLGSMAGAAWFILGATHHRTA